MKKANKNNSPVYKDRTIKAEIFKHVLSNINLSNYSVEEQKTIIETVREVTRKTVIDKKNVSRVYAKKITFNVLDKSVRNIEEVKGIKVKAWIPKPTQNEVIRLISKRETRFNYIPKPPKRFR